MTKSPIALAAIAALGLAGLAQAPALAQDHSDHRAGPAAPGVVSGTGVIKSVNAAGGTVVITHDPMPALKWPAMTMPFKVSDPALLKGLKPGMKVVFDLKDKKTIVAIKPADAHAGH